MIVRHFLGWVRTASASERAEATRALAQSWLWADLSDDDRAATEGALLMQLDDASPLVRQAIVEVFASSHDAPPAIVHALSCDQNSVALPILEQSPLLKDADLVDIVATGDEAVQCAVARRADLPPSICAAIAEVGCVNACLVLIGNESAEIAELSLDRIVARFGHVAAVRERLLECMELPAATRLALVSRLSGALAQFVSGKNWLSADRAARVTHDACEKSTVNIAVQSRGDELTAFVRHLRESGKLTSGMILRTLLSGNIELFECALVELTGLGESRVAAIVHERGGASLDALLTKAGLPPMTLPAFRAALAAMSEIGFAGVDDGVARLRRRMVERVLTACETMASEESEPLLILLRRFAAESAREEARMFCDDLAAEDGLSFDVSDRLVA